MLAKLFIKRIHILAIVLILIASTAPAQYQKADGHKGIWFTLGQFSDYGDKYSGGLGTYTGDRLPVSSNIITQGYPVPESSVKSPLFSLKVGTESRGEVMKDILFEDNDVIESDRGMALYCSDGATFRNIRYINNRFEDNYPDAKQSWMNFTITKRNPDSKPGSMIEILVKDCSFEHPFPKVSEISGFDETHRIVMTIDNLKVGGIRCNTEKEASIKNKGFADISFK